VKEWLKSVLNCRSYPKNKLGIRFFGPPCILFNCIHLPLCAKQSDDDDDDDDYDCDDCNLICTKAELEERAADASSAEEQVKRLSNELSSHQDQLRREKDRLSQVDNSVPQ